MSAVAIRPAREADAPQLATLSEVLGYPVATAEMAARLSALAARDDQAVWVAAGADGTVSGWIHLTLVQRLGSPPFAEIGGLVVDTGRRRAGLGRRLVEAGAAWAAEQGVARLRVRTRDRRADAIAFYRALGFEASKKQVVFDRRLDPRGRAGVEAPAGGRW